jgi:hypothetical protein
MRKIEAIRICVSLICTIYGLGVLVAIIFADADKIKDMLPLVWSLVVMLIILYVIMLIDTHQGNKIRKEKESEWYEKPEKK